MDALPLRVAVTGHRPQHLFGFDSSHEGWKWLQAQLRRLVAEAAAQGPCEFLSGMALGVDTVFANEVVRAHQPLVAFVPFDGQDTRWKLADRLHHEHLLRCCCRVRFVSRLPSLEAFHRRNQAMVDACDVVVAAWNGKSSGGTYHCLQAALAAGRPVVWLDTEARRVVLVGA